MEDRIKELEEKIEKIEKRNKRVEGEQQGKKKGKKLFEHMKTSLYIRMTGLDQHCMRYYLSP